MYILLLFHFVRSCSVLLRSPARDRLVRPVDDHPLVVVRPSRGGHRRGPGLVETYRFKEIQVCAPLVPHLCLCKRSFSDR